MRLKTICILVSPVRDDLFVKKWHLIIDELRRSGLFIAESPDLKVGAAMKRMEKLLLDSKKLL